MVTITDIGTLRQTHTIYLGSQTEPANTTQPYALLSPAPCLPTNVRRRCKLTGTLLFCDVCLAVFHYECLPYGWDTITSADGKHAPKDKCYCLVCLRFGRAGLLQGVRLTSCELSTPSSRVVSHSPPFAYPSRTFPFATSSHTKQAEPGRDGGSGGGLERRRRQ